MWLQPVEELWSGVQLCIFLKWVNPSLWVYPLKMYLVLLRTPSDICNKVTATAHNATEVES
jgi:hypothetical protein